MTLNISASDLNAIKHLGELISNLNKKYFKREGSSDKYNCIASELCGFENGFQQAKKVLPESSNDLYTKDEFKDYRESLYGRASDIRDDIESLRSSLRVDSELQVFLRLYDLLSKNGHPLIGLTPNERVTLCENASHTYHDSFFLRIALGENTQEAAYGNMIICLLDTYEKLMLERQ